MNRLQARRIGRRDRPSPRRAGPSQGGWSLIEVVAAIVVVGLGISLFVKVQGMSSRGSGTNSKQLVAGRMIEKFLEDTRIHIARDTLKNWPPKDTTVKSAAPNFITLTSKVSDARSPKDNAVVLNVKRVDIACRWTIPVKDSLKVTTYVAKRF